MSDGDQRSPLWATSLAPEREPEPGRDDGAPDGPPPVAAQPPFNPRVAAVRLLVLAAIVGLAAALAGRGSVTLAEVPSSWGPVPMTCDTARFEEEDRAVELFSCRATAGGTLPPGVYRSPASRWTSDLTRRDALVNEMVIAPDGDLTGVAVY